MSGVIVSRQSTISLIESQALFAFHFQRLLEFLHNPIQFPDIIVVMGEGFVGLSIDADEDSPHLRTGAHFRKMANDLDLYRRLPDGTLEWLSNADPVWDKAGAFWKSLDPANRWGGDFKSRDYNHFSRFHGGTA